jgi:hypothetical protein
MEPRQSCFARLLDVRGYVIAARAATYNAEPAALLAMMAGFGLIGALLFPFWLSYDLASTWEFTTSLRDGSADALNSMAYQLDGLLNITIGGAIAGFLLTGYTLLPSLFELAFPTVTHPLLMILLAASLLFDFITDWGKSWATVASWGGADNPIAHVLYAVGFCLFVSIFIQALLVVCATVIWFGVLGLVRGGARQAQAVIIQQQ